MRRRWRFKFIKQLFEEDFTKLYFAPDRDRDPGPHIADAFPPKEQKPIFPKIDIDVNPFGCKAFARKFNLRSLPGIPGPSSEEAMPDTNEPPKQPWHAF
jgi:hypothetical protein